MTPHIPTAFSVPTDGVIPDLKPTSKAKGSKSDGSIPGDVSFKKKWVVGSIGPAAGSLKKLLEVGKPNNTVKAAQSSQED